VQLEERALKEVERGRRPQFAFVPGVAHRRLVTDLDRVMTVEKSIVAGWERTPGYTTVRTVPNMASPRNRRSFQ